ncbi:hypothetical protein [Prochlorococcus marinus]|uniref:hypothetical protein n=1 Tax=Prochlorococcus marinus TaxID=1219 RepID=UPI0022B54075|nr:hypothetical protein [Prochlorococcus marinus]
MAELRHSCVIYFFSLTVLLTGCITSGGGAGGSYPAGWNQSFPGQPQELLLVMVLLANIMNSIARQVNTPTCVIARDMSMT